MIAVLLLLGIGGIFSQWRRAELHATLERSERNRAQSALNQMEAIEVRRAEEYYEAGDRRNMLPYLALVLRQNPSNRIAAERLFSTLSHGTGSPDQTNPGFVKLSGIGTITGGTGRFHNATGQ
jgi:hypothetical protein